MQKLGQVGAWTRSRDLFLNFGTRFISLERTKLETASVGLQTKKMQK